jgi:hypothetical protein
MELQVEVVRLDSETTGVLPPGRFFAACTIQPSAISDRRGLVLRIASSDVRMITGEPDLLQPIRIFVWPLGAGLMPAGPPNLGEVRAILINRHRVARVPDRIVNVEVVEFHPRET